MPLERNVAVTQEKAHASAHGNPLSHAFAITANAAANAKLLRVADHGLDAKQYAN